MHALEPKRPEGHFWLTANMGAMAESFGLIAEIRTDPRLIVSSKRP